MKAFLLSLSFTACALFINAQDVQVHSLPAGKYETFIKNDQSRWERGDIILLEGNKYKISTSDEVGDYKFSSVAQRVFFTSGPLKSVFAKTFLKKDTPVIVLPVAENEELGLKASSDICGYYRH